MDVNDEEITKKQHQEISGMSQDKSKKFCVLGMQPQGNTIDFQSYFFSEFFSHISLLNLASCYLSQIFGYYLE